MLIPRRLFFTLGLVAVACVSAIPVVGQDPKLKPAKKRVELKQSSEAQLAKGDINFDDLVFKIEKNSAFDKKLYTDRVKKLDGRNVTLSGYMLPSSIFQTTGIQQFVLVRDNKECCFGPGAFLYDCVFVVMADRNTAKFTTRPVKVKGTFALDSESYRYPPGTGEGDATHMAVFRIDATEVR